MTDQAVLSKVGVMRHSVAGWLRRARSCLPEAFVTNTAGMEMSAECLPDTATTYDPPRESRNKFRDVIRDKFREVETNLGT